MKLLAAKLAEDWQKKKIFKLNLEVWGLVIGGLKEN
jgi:hypothetical protein